ncbi:MAG: RNA polymerase sigma factor, partial [Bacteroidales bacterium]
RYSGNPLPGENGSEDPGSYSDLKEVLERAIGQLPDDQRAVVMLRDYEGYAYREISEITGLSESQVKVYIYRARVFLKHYIGSMEKVI